MRPLRLEVSGFTAFAEETVLELEDAPFFSFVGPTGSGKSSLIDAMTFALYGKVPRLDPRMVWPVVTQGRTEARIRLDFALGDERFTAVRVVRKTGPAAGTTKEARLERWAGPDREGEVIAGDADGVSAEVERLLGLTFQQFCTCVVLPQGDFARFMRDEPSKRQDLLVNLLDLKVYGEMQQRANQRAATAIGQVEVMRRRLEEDLGYVTPEALVEAKAALQDFHELQARMDADEPRLEALRAAVAEAREAHKRATARIEALAALRVPDDIESAAATLNEARAHAEAADKAVAAAEQLTRRAEKDLAALPPRAPLDQALDAHHQRESVLGQIEGANATLSIAARKESTAAEALAIAEAAHRAATDALEHARIQHAAADLARTLIAGEPCPVCDQVVHDLPAHGGAADLDRAAAEVKTAAASVKAATKDHKETADALVRAQASIESFAARLGELDARLAAAPARADLERELQSIEAATVALAEARAAEAAARASHAAALADLTRAMDAIEGSWRALESARDPVADLGAPAPGRKDLAADWRLLATWAIEQAEAQMQATRAAQDAEETARAEGVAIDEARRALCAERGLEVDGNPRDVVLRAVERASARASDLELKLETAAEIRADVDRLTEQERVAKALGQHLRANMFEKWLLDETMDALEEGATEMLLQLSNGQYSLTRDKTGNFAVIDHRAADQVRLARTLSGGETFLASLALALALGERVAQMSANSAVRLESIFLDEGFGTLDPETLEVVADAIERLSGSSRVVGIVTHVRELGERTPVRFEVVKGATGSTVRKVLT